MLQSRSGSSVQEKYLLAFAGIKPLAPRLVTVVTELFLYLSSPSRRLSRDSRTACNGATVTPPVGGSLEFDTADAFTVFNRRTYYETE